MNPDDLRDRVTAIGLDLGFTRVGVAALGKVERYDAYEKWLDRGLHGDMEFLASESHRRGRQNHHLILQNALSAVVVAAAYSATGSQPPAGRGYIARYARGDDYHRVVKERLRALADELARETGATFASRPCVDTAPILERALAEAAGIGFIGKNTMLITPGLGSFTVLGELFTDIEISPTAPLTGDHCGSCRACLDACPTAAFVAPYQLDSRRCISYLTIEHRSAIADDLRTAMNNRIFGCDDCQTACPYNQRAPMRTPAFAGLEDRTPEAGPPTLAAVASLRSGDYRRLTRGSAMSRARRGMLRRNAAIAIGNEASIDEDTLAALCECLAAPEPATRSAAAWALGRHQRSAPLEAALEGETDAGVRREIMAALSHSATGRAR